MVRPAEIALTVTQLGTHIGARIDGVRLGGDLDPSVVDRLRAALLQLRVTHHVHEPRTVAAHGDNLGYPRLGLGLVRGLSHDAAPVLRQVTI
nr:hypothetical protein MFLOJ_35720 [Mycobacterium florentinum]